MSQEIDKPGGNQVEKIILAEKASIIAERLVGQALKDAGFNMIYKPNPKDIPAVGCLVSDCQTMKAGLAIARIIDELEGEFESLSDKDRELLSYIVASVEVKYGGVL